MFYFPCTRISGFAMPMMLVVLAMRILPSISPWRTPVSAVLPTTTHATPTAAASAAASAACPATLHRAPGTGLRAASKPVHWVLFDGLPVTSLEFIKSFFGSRL
mmetsp:Transcript_15137/g.23952  ORF Transcript_15137/g.23952 Transcript_15137/m.23952 type:complete len:104 (-) Transcript_15137:867-1178(-)